MKLAGGACKGCLQALARDTWTSSSKELGRRRGSVGCTRRLGRAGLGGECGGTHRNAYAKDCQLLLRATLSDTDFRKSPMEGYRLCGNAVSRNPAGHACTRTAAALRILLALSVRP